MLLELQNRTHHLLNYYYVPDSFDHEEIVNEMAFLSREICVAQVSRMRSAEAMQSEKMTRNLTWEGLVELGWAWQFLMMQSEKPRAVVVGDPRSVGFLYGRLRFDHSRSSIAEGWMAFVYQAIWEFGLRFSEPELVPFR